MREAVAFYLSRLLASALVLGPVALIVATPFRAPAIPPFDSLSTDCAIVGALILTAYNLWVGVLQPMRNQRREQAQDGRHSSSPAPLLGSILMFIALARSPGSWPMALFGAIIFLTDIGGFGMLAIAIFGGVFDSALPGANSDPVEK